MYKSIFNIDLFLIYKFINVNIKKQRERDSE